ncbi:DUF4893 domain-containing protein [Sphingomicrobium nitratireducens]|uniref:DUF4893 domain-containing protein n=1 Tax=Sphingomicrobium nitratireducens TaxID=2964666 RepID=UPI00223ECA08|nr:DUF4893 domain-containing protein [Sphingomicrobium nitratireducens]
MTIALSIGGMRVDSPLLALVACGLLSACTTAEPVVPPAPAAVMVEEADPEGWESIVSAADNERLGRLEEAWTQGFDETLKFKSAIENEGELLDPDAGLARAAPTPGSYRCRLVKLGKAKKSDPAFIAYQPFFCYIDLDGERFTIVKQTGTQRPAGRLWEESDSRFIYLGSLSLGNENAPLAYGEDPERDMAGVFERVGPFRWRLVIPFPRNGGTLDVFELTPTADQPE